MKNHTETLEWPLTAKAIIARGKYFNESSAEKVFTAVRFLDDRSGRYFYDLYENEILSMQHVNPLFLDFIETI